MPDKDKALAAVLRASQRVEKAETGLTAARTALYQAVRDAQAAGVSISAMARELGVTRQAVQKMARR